MISRLAKQAVRGFFLLYIGISSAGQNLSVEDGKTYSVKVSANELTRITVEKGRLEKVWGLNNNWDLKADKDAGEIYIRPKEGQKKAFSFFAKDNFGNTYTLVALPFDIPSETIVLDPVKRVSKAKNADAKDQPYIVQIKGLIKDMANDQEESYSVTDLDEVIPLWQEARIILKKQYELNEFIGEIYVLQNVSGKEMILNEREFSGFGEGVAGVSVENNVLQANEATRLYIVRHSKG